MYVDRVRTLEKAYRAAERNNELYAKKMRERDQLKAQQDFLERLAWQLNALDGVITQKESEWREAVLSVLEAEITEYLTQVYPTDGYRIQLNTKVLRGKIHINAKVSSIFAKDIPGRIRGTQGRLFQQVVSFSALVGVTGLLGVKTLYVDEAFSGSSKKNVRKLNGLLRHLKDRGYNLIMIAQDTNMADGIAANRLFLTRSTDNKTTVLQEVLAE